ncbi:MAG TPA: dienelactone hydrolase family protein [Thermoanaerobaculia bacterium]|nr:dienelactone hydrolase family protein [Thermoanaerobaculia bacterium]
MNEHEVQVPTPDGTADAVFFESGKDKPGVVFLPDGIGLRPSQRQMARRVAGLGCNVLVPNIYYRSGKPPFFGPKPDLTDEKTRARFQALTSLVSPDAQERDGAAYVDFVAARSAGPIAVAGFCFSGQFALRTAAARPERVLAAASFHGGGLYKDDPSSPHLVLPRVKARLYFGHAKDDRGMPAEAIRRLDNALVAWGGRYESDIYDARHGWTVPDSAAYDEPEAERAFAKLRGVLAATLSGRG